MTVFVSMFVIAASIGANVYLTRQLSRSISLIEDLARPQRRSTSPPASQPHPQATSRPAKPATKSTYADKPLPAGKWWKLATSSEWVDEPDVTETTINMLNYEEGTPAPPTGIHRIANGMEMLVAQNPANPWEYIAKKRPVRAHTRHTSSGDVQVGAHTSTRSVKQAAKKGGKK